jgi:hypothetical protein
MELMEVHKVCLSYFEYSGQGYNFLPYSGREERWIYWFLYELNNAMPKYVWLTDAQGSQNLL